MVNFHRYVFKVMIMLEFGYIILEKCSGRQFLSTGAQTEKPQSPFSHEPRLRNKLYETLDFTVFQFNTMKER